MKELTSKTNIFLWTGTNKSGKRIQGEINAANPSIVYAQLRHQGIIPLQVKTKPKPLFSIGKQTVKNADIVVFSRHLATMLSAGITLVHSLDIIANSNDNLAMKALVLKIKTEVEGGNTLNSAISKYPKYFSKLFCNLIKAGELSGSLDTMLIRVANYTEKLASIRKKIKKALTYPAIVVAVAILVSLILLVFVVPKFETLFSSYGKQLPTFTQYVLDTSKFVRDYWWIILIFTTFATMAFMFAKKRYEKFRRFLDKLKLKIVVFGPIIRKAIIARFARTLATTLAAGIPITDALRASAEIADNSVYSDAIMQVRERVETGQPLHASMENTQIFPKMVTQMIAVGEESGSIESMLNKVADYYEEDVNTAVDNMSSLLEPFILIILGVVVGGLITSMYLPIFKLGSVF